MDVCSDIKCFIEELEVYAKQKLNYPAEVGELLQIVINAGIIKEFEYLIFQAKFLVRTQDIITRIGPGTEGFEKLSAEFQSGLMRSNSLINLIIERAPSAVDRKLTSLFNTAEKENLYRLMKLFNDLSWIKNWQIDGKLLPYEGKSALKTSCQSRLEEKEYEPLVRIQKSLFLIIILFIIFLFIDPPVTLIGWILLLGIAVFLVYIVVQIYILKRTKKHNKEE